MVSKSLSVARLLGSLVVALLISGAAVAQQSSLTAAVSGGTPGTTATYTLTYVAGTPYIGDVAFNIALDPAVVDVATATCTLADFTGRPNAANVSVVNTDCFIDAGTGVVTLRLATNLNFPVLEFPEGLAATLSLPILAAATLPSTPDITIPAGQTGGDAGGNPVAITEANFTLVEATIDGMVTTEPDITVAPTTLTFMEGTGATQTVTITNDGTDDLSITAIALATGTEFSFADNAGDPCGTLPATLAPTENCVIDVTYGGTGTAGDTLTISSNDPDEQAVPVALNVTPIGGGACDLTIAPTTVTFDLQALVSPQTVTVTNAGTVDCTGTTVTISGNYTQTSACADPLLPAGTCDISVADNGSAAGDAGVLTVTSNEDTVTAAVNTVDGALAPVSIPTISQWSMIIVASLLGLVAMVGLRRREG